MATETVRDTSVILQRRLWRGFLYMVVLVLAILFMFPYFWTVSSSLKATHELYTWPPKWLPEEAVWNNYPHVFELHPFGMWFRNTVLVTILSTIGLVASATVVAYSFARLRWPGRDFIFLITLATMMLPAEVTLIPKYLLFKEFGWVDDLKSLWVPSYLGGGAFDIFLLRQFIQTIPRDLDEAALIDGAGRLKILTSVIVPLTKPAIATVTVIHFVWKWSEFMQPMIFLNSTKKLTVAIGLRFFERWGNTVGQSVPQDNYLMAACVMSSTPVLLLFFFTQRFFVQGIVMTGLKG